MIIIDILVLLIKTARIITRRLPTMAKYRYLYLIVFTKDISEYTPPNHGSHLKGGQGEHAAQRAFHSLLFIKI